MVSLSQSEHCTQQLPPYPPSPSLPSISPPNIWPDAEGGGRWRLQAVGGLGVDTAEGIKQWGVGGACYLPGIAKPREATPGPGGGKAEARFWAGLKDAHRLQTPCPLPILQTTWGAGGLWVRHVQRFTSKTKSQVVAWL